MRADYLRLVGAEQKMHYNGKFVGPVAQLAEQQTLNFESGIARHFLTLSSTYQEPLLRAIV
jgi:hypothetical protein